ncbi:MAG: peptidoglycan-binding protein [Bacillota bacterium]|nr:peptidoglycan-binding protein [Bacillota bacterium]
MSHKRKRFIFCIIPALLISLSVQTTFAYPNTTLKSGVSGNSVLKLQKDLKNLGFISFKPTGYFGSLTQQGVKRFQKRYGLASDGIAGSITLTKIDKILGRTTTQSRGSTDRKSQINPINVKKQWIPGLPQDPYNKGIGKYEGVVFHYTNNLNDNAQKEATYEKNNWNEAFVHEFIDPGQCIQVANPDYQAWGAGEYGNHRFIHIELCDASNQSDFNTSYNMVTQRIAEYLYKRKLGVTPAKPDGSGTLWSHADVSNYLGGTDHKDPIAYLAKWGKTWQDVINSVTKYYNILKEQDNNN